MTMHCTLFTTYPERTRLLMKTLMGITIQALTDPQFVSRFVRKPSDVPQLIEDANEAIRIISETFDFFPIQLENTIGMTQAVEEIKGDGVQHGEPRPNQAQCV